MSTKSFFTNIYSVKSKLQMKILDETSRGGKYLKRLSGVVRRKCCSIRHKLLQFSCTRRSTIKTSQHLWIQQLKSESKEEMDEGTNERKSRKRENKWFKWIIIYTSIIIIISSLGTVEIVLLVLSTSPCSHFHFFAHFWKKITSRWMAFWGPFCSLLSGKLLLNLYT